MTKRLNGATMRDMCALLGLKFEAGRAPTAPKLDVNSGYVSRCAKLHAAVSLLPVANGEQTEDQHESCHVIGCAITLSMLVLGLLWLMYVRWTAVKPSICEKATPTIEVGIETRVFFWTEHGARLRFDRSCASLKRAKHVY